MGRSAKVHKRIKKSKSSISQHQSQSQQTSTTKALTKPPPPPPSTTTSSSVPPNTKRRATLKEKASKVKSRKSGEGIGHVLGGADYVQLMMGSRRRAKEEAAKLPPPS